MFSKNNHYMNHIKQHTPVKTYSIRKFTVGVASIAIVAFLLGGQSTIASAQEELEPVIVEEAVDEAALPSEVEDVLLDIDEGTLEY
ncbi:YSIRK-type signal peptide-containing protein [Dolosicoccus paucivorans]|uniref:YSIRK Gram-positive signal peptide domain-containing protein n=1 Tax=Dolosicoccus paucivorans TaxID=84521 RepID=A0A1G8PTF0_9LACT|nr:YSIRK-type signal peptide-containing protein [Dolosicoccus paucivorans]PMB84226.1 hypothetical protein CJ206_05175 [Dolosicoccus paucivorans]PMC58689.1 hypothetical protein CJ205_03195 [Dolosicoccus paucivorans]SDI95757.1 signal peptide-containing protein, YSIRK family [Dolosicoccus paucivorans]